jgi:predicted metal-dependent phosphoesterase TrpH
MRDAAAFSDPLYTMPVDLHVHSTRSDGTFTPTQLVSMAKEKGLAAFALTDHDSVNGIEEAMDAAKRASIDAAKRASIDAARDTGVEVIPGIELSTEYEGKDVHIVGLYYDYEDPDFQSAVNEFTQERVRRN